MNAFRLVAFALAATFFTGSLASQAQAQDQKASVEYEVRVYVQKGNLWYNKNLKIVYTSESEAQAESFAAKIEYYVEKDPEAIHHYLGIDYPKFHIVDVWVVPVQY